MLSIYIVKFVCLTLLCAQQPQPTRPPVPKLTDSDNNSDSPSRDPDIPGSSRFDQPSAEPHRQNPILSPATSFSDCDTLSESPPISPPKISTNSTQDQVSISNIFSSIYPSTVEPQKLLPLPSPRSMPRPILPTSPLYRRGQAREKVICLFHLIFVVLF